MRYTTALVGLLLLMPALVACYDQKVTTAWAEAPIMIDGSSSDWPDSAITFFPDEEISLGAANDSTHLYLLLRFRNAGWAKAIRMTGLSLWVNPEGNKNRDIGLKYVGGPTPPGPEQQTDQRSQMLARITPPAEQLLFIEKERLAEVPIPTDGSMGPAVAFDTTNGVYTYECAIPLQTSVAGSYGIAMSPGQKYAVGAEWGNMEELREQMWGQSGGRGGMGGGTPGGTMGGRSGGGRGGPPGGGRLSGGQRPEIEEKEYWLKSVTAGPTTEE